MCVAVTSVTNLIPIPMTTHALVALHQMQPLLSWHTTYMSAMLARLPYLVHVWASVHLSHLVYGKRSVAPLDL